MKTGDRLRQAVRREVRQHPLKMAKCNRALIKILRIADLLQRVRILHEMIRPPVLPVTVHKIRLPRFRADKIKCLPLRITALRTDLLLQVGRHMKNIIHQRDRILKY